VEQSVDAALAAASPRATRYLGWPLRFALQAGRRADAAVGAAAGATLIAEPGFSAPSGRVPSDRFRRSARPPCRPACQGGPMTADEADPNRTAPRPAAPPRPRVGWPWALPLVLVAILALWAADVRGTWEPPYLLVSLYLVLATLASLAVVWLVAHSFLADGSPGLLTLGCGVLFWGLSAIFAGLAGESDPDVMVAIHNLGSWLSAACHAASAWLLVRPRRPLGARRAWLLSANLAVIAALTLLTALALTGALPVFFVQGQGGTAVRQVVLGSASALLGATALFQLHVSRARGSSFARVYGLALGLWSLGLLAVLVQTSVASAIGWVGRLAQIGGCLYMLGAAIAAVRETGAVGLPFAGALREARREYEALRRRSAEALYESEERFRVMADSAPSLLWVSDAGGETRFVNRSYREFFGVSAEEVAGGRWQPLLHPDDVAGYVAAFRRASQERTSFRCEARARRADGEWRWFEVHAAPRSTPDGAYAGHVGMCLDVTERRRAEEALREAERPFRIMADSAPAVLWVTDERGRNLFVNRLYCEFFGTTLEQVSGDDWHPLVHPEDGPGYVAALQAAARDRAVFRAEARVRRADGAWRWIVSHAEPRFSTPGGEFVGHVGITVDVTERRSAEEGLRRSEALYRAIAENIPGGAVCVVDEDLRFAVAEGPLLRRLGFGREALEGRTPREAFDASTAASVEEALRAALAGAATTREFDLGPAGVLWAQAAPLPDDDQRVRRALVLALDITEPRRAEERRRQAEAMLRVVGEASQDAIYVKDRDSRVVFANPATARAVGKPMERIVGHRDDEFYDNPAHAAEILANDRLVVTEGVPQTFEESVAAADGRRVFLSSKVPWRDERGAVLGLIGISRDITARKRTEEQLRELSATLERRVAERTAEAVALADQLRALASELSQVEQRERRRLATILHDHLQQLLVAAKLRLETVARNPAGAPLRTRLHEVGETIQEAITASRSLTVELSPPVLHEAGLGPALVWLGGRLKEKDDLRVEVHAEPGAEPLTEDVRALLFEAARELLFNTRKHAGVASARVTLDRSGDGGVRLVVEDGGRGFDPAAARQSRARGEGFGLFSIAQRLAYLGGRMDIDSAPGRGARVVLWAPRGERGGPAAVPDERVAPRIGPAAGSGPAARIRVLIADDHRILREGLVGLLGVEEDLELVGEAGDGDEAIRLAHDLRPDVVVMDVNLPRTNGVTATRAIVRDLPRVNVVGLSMHTDADVADAMRRAGAVAYVTKGGPAEDLIAAIRLAAAPAPTAGSAPTLEAATS
jgi:PAS domain S-box-containing protein